MSLDTLRNACLRRGEGLSYEHTQQLTNTLKLHMTERILLLQFVEPDVYSHVCLFTNYRFFSLKHGQVDAFFISDIRHVRSGDSGVRSIGQNFWTGEYVTYPLIGVDTSSLATFLLEFRNAIARPSLPKNCMYQENVHSDTKALLLKKQKYVKNERLDILWTKDHVQVGLTNYRIFKIEGTQVSSCPFENMVTASFLDQGMFRWSKVQVLMKNEALDTYGIYDTEVIQYFVKYINKILQIQNYIRS